MELPHIGQHCNDETCNKLDFLPFKCDSCEKVFCSSHFNYEKHSCPGAHRKNVQVPVCPLCGDPVPTAPGEEPDLTVGRHIDQQCKSDTKKIFTNRCSYKACKRKELIPVTCAVCKQNFCLRHRHTADHECSAGSSKSGGPSSSRGPIKKATTQSEEDTKTMAARAAEYRRSNKPTTLFNANPKPSVVAARAAAQRSTNAAQVQSIQGNMTEDEALARAMALSIMEQDERGNRHNEPAPQTVAVGGRDAKDKCSLS